jgi:TatD DNase family protein
VNEQPPLWIDSHAHLTMFEPTEVGSSLERAAARGVVGVIVPATNPDDLPRTLEIGVEFVEMVRVAAGVHPHDARRLDDGFKRRIQQCGSAPSVVAIGEIGLDYHYMNSPREDQIRAFEWQLDLAIDSRLPVIIHNRESWLDMARILEDRSGRLRGVCHSFTENPERARFVQDCGLYVGVSGMVTFKRADNIRSMTAAIAPERLLVETDSPFLAPVPHRGQPNEPAFVVDVGHMVAGVLGLDVADVAAHTTRNVADLFGFNPREGGASREVRPAGGEVADRGGAAPTSG